MSKNTLGTPLGRDPKFLGELSGPKVTTDRLRTGLTLAADDLEAGQMQPILDGTGLVFNYKDAAGGSHAQSLGDHHWDSQPGGGIGYDGVVAVQELRGAVDLWRAMLKSLAMNAPLDSHDVELFNHQAGTQGRGTVALYQDAEGVWRQAAANVSPFDNEHYLHEPQRTNRCATNNANPTDITGITKGGDEAATLTVVDDSAALAAAGLDVICNTGKVFKLDNTGGTANAFASVSGGPLNPAEVHVASAFVRGDAGFLSWSGGGSPTNFDASADFIRITHTGVPVGSGQAMVGAPPGATVYFILPQLEQGGSVTNPIVTTGAATSRATNSLTWDLGPAMQAALASAGSLVWEFIPLAGSGVNYYFLALDGDSWAYIASDNNIKLREGVGLGTDLPIVPVTGQAYMGAARWNTATNQKQVGISTDGGATWTWSAVATYAGMSGFSQLSVGTASSESFRLRGLRIVPAWLDDTDLSALASHMHAGVLSLGVDSPRALLHLAGGIMAAVLMGKLRATLETEAPALLAGQLGSHQEAGGNLVFTAKDGSGVSTTYTLTPDV